MDVLCDRNLMERSENWAMVFSSFDEALAKTILEKHKCFEQIIHYQTTVTVRFVGVLLLLLGRLTQLRDTQLL